MTVGKLRTEFRHFYDQFIAGSFVRDRFHDLGDNVAGPLNQDHIV